MNERPEKLYMLCLLYGGYSLSKIQTCSDVKFDKDVSFLRVLCTDVSFTIVYFAVVSFFKCIFSRTLLSCNIAIIDQCLYIHTHLWYWKNPTTSLVFALLILIIVSLNNGKHRFLLIQFEYLCFVRSFRSFFFFFFDRQHIDILFINKSDELIRGIPELFFHEMCVL